MKKFKKYIIGFVVAMVLSSGLITAAFASGLLVWGGEDNIAYISDTLNFLGGRISEEEQNVKNAEQANGQYQNTIKDLENQVANKDKELANKQQEIENKQSEIDQKLVEIEQKNKEIQDKISELGI